MKMKKLLSVFLACAMVISLLPEAATRAKAADTENWTKYATAVTPSGKTYTVNSAEELAWVASQCNSGNNYFSSYTVKLGTDIGLSAHLWTPIGTQFNSFKGTFDGNGKTITGLTVSGADTDYNVGLFGYIYCATIQNVMLSDVSISAAETGTNDHYAGALVGFVNNSAVTGCSASGTVSVSNSTVDADPYTYYAGGLIGYINNGSTYEVSDCSSSVSLSASCVLQTTSRCVIGGLIGGVGTYAAIKRSYATGAISNTNNIFAGGLVGQVVGMQSSISNSYATGSITGSFSYGGGLVGRISIGDTTVANCYAMGDVKDDSNKETYAGGLVGNTATSSISYSYSAGEASGASNNGGFAGEYNSSDGVSDVYYNSTNSNGIGVINSSSQILGFTGLSAEDMKISFASTLNTNQSPAPWLWIPGKNNNYPVLDGVGDGIAPTYTVSGKLSAGSTGVTALDDIEVKLYKYDSGTYTYSATTYKANTADGGGFTIANVPDGTYRAVIAAGSNYGESAAADDFTVSGADVTAGTDIALAPKPKYTITNSGENYLVNGSGTSTTLNAALAGKDEETIQLGSAVAPLSISAVTTGSTNDLVSARYTGWVRYARSGYVGACALRVPSGASVIFSSLKIDCTDATGPKNYETYVNGGRLMVEDGTVITSPCANDYGIYCDNGSVTGNGGTIGNGKNVGIENTGSGTLTINGGSISASTTDNAAVVQSSSGTLTVTGGSIAATDTAGLLIEACTGKVTVSGGTVSAVGNGNAAIHMNPGTGTVALDIGASGASGPTISGTGGAIAIQCDKAEDPGTCAVNIKSGTVTGDLFALCIMEGCTASLTGGTVSSANSISLYGAVIINQGGVLNISGGTVSAESSNLCAIMCTGGNDAGGAVSISDNAEINSASPNTIWIMGSPSTDTVNIFGKTVNSSDKNFIFVGGKSAGSKYEINKDNYGDASLNAEVQGTDLLFGYWSKDAGGKALLSTTNPETLSNLTTGVNSAVTTIYLCVISEKTANLLPGSLGTAGDGKITGLTSATKYKVTVGDTVYYVKADGTMSSNSSDAAALTGTEITGLTNGMSYKVEIYIPGGNGDGGSYTSPTQNNASVIVGGRTQNVGTTETITVGGKTTTAVTISTDKLKGILESSGSGATVTLPITTGSDTVSGKLDGKAVKNMEEKDATLVIDTGTASYTLPASEINIDSVSGKFGQSVSLSDISVSVSISEPSGAEAKVVQDAAASGGYAIQVPAVEFTVSCTYGGQTVAVSTFSSYVERTIAIPDGVDSSKITTAIVVEADGSVHHVPTEVTVVDGKYYAKINSLTNSVYTLIYNPLKFSDVENHWAKDAINDMGSRLVVSGVGNNNYAPDRNIARAEFAAIMVRALGLEPGTGTNGFKDVASADWFCGYVKTAASYGIINGYDSSTFGPNDMITREQAMAMMARAMKITGLKVSLTDRDASSLLAAYTDASSASDYAVGSIAACLKTGVVSGTSKNTISPKDYVTRAEVAVMAERLLKQSGLI